MRQIYRIKFKMLLEVMEIPKNILLVDINYSTIYKAKARYA